MGTEKKPKETRKSAKMATSDIEWIEQAELYFALSDTDSKFEKVLDNFLCPLLLKLDIADEAVKQKVLALLTHINKLLKSSNTLKIPFQL